MAVKGVFASDSNIQGTRRGDFASALLQYETAGAAPLLALSSGMRKESASDVMVGWFEEGRLTGRESIVNNAGVGTTFTLVDASAVVAGKIFMVETTGEYVFVESVSGNAIVVTRGIGGTVITAFDGSGTPVAMQSFGTGQEEGSARPTSVANVGKPVTNYMQIFRNSWDVTGTAKAVAYQTGDVVAKNKRDAAMYHAEDMERALMFGRQDIGVRNGKPFRLMDGIFRQIEARQDVAGAITSEGANSTWRNIDDFLGAVFTNNIKGQPNERVCALDNTGLGVLGQIAAKNGQMQFKSGQREFGMNIARWLTPYGELTLVTHPLLNEMPVFKGNLYVYHPAALKTRYLRETHEDSVQNESGNDADFGVYTTEMSCEYHMARTGGVYSGLSVAA